MQTKKKEIEYRIKEAAKNEFFEKGYKNGSISRIAKAAKVPIGNLYRYFPSKKALLDGVVKEAYDFIPKFITDLAGTATLREMPLEEFSVFIAKELYRVFWRSRAELNILLHKCQGTEYEYFKDAVNERIYNIIVNRNFGDRKISDSERILSKVVANGYLDGVLEVLNTEWREERFTELIQKITLFFFKEFKSRG